MRRREVRRRCARLAMPAMRRKARSAVHRVLAVRTARDPWMGERVWRGLRDRAKKKITKALVVKNGRLPVFLRTSRALPQASHTAMVSISNRIIHSTTARQTSPTADCNVRGVQSSPTCIGPPSPVASASRLDGARQAARSDARQAHRCPRRVARRRSHPATGARGCATRKSHLRNCRQWQSRAT